MKLKMPQLSGSQSQDPPQVLFGYYQDILPENPSKGIYYFRPHKIDPGRFYFHQRLLYFLSADN